MACENERCNYSRFCRLNVNGFVDHMECIEYDHLESMRQDAETWKESYEEEEEEEEEEDGADS